MIEGQTLHTMAQTQPTLVGKAERRWRERARTGRAKQTGKPAMGEAARSWIEREGAHAGWAKKSGKATTGKHTVPISHFDRN